MGIQTVELLLDEAGDAAIRAQWQALHEAGIPSLGAPAAPVPSPHITLTARQSIGPDREAALISSFPALPIAVHVGAPMIFGRDPRHLVLVRSVVASSELLHVQRTVHETLGSTDDVSPLTEPGNWTPHITLARLSIDHLEQALSILVSMDMAPTRAASVRRWDGTAKREWTLLPDPDAST